MTFLDLREYVIKTIMLTGDKPKKILMTIDSFEKYQNNILSPTERGTKKFMSIPIEIVDKIF